MKPIIHAENLSKLYRIGAKERRYKTFREAIVDGITAPLRNLRRLRRLTNFDSEEFEETSALSRTPNDTIWALKDVSFDVQPGEVIGIIGRNGAGKSTLLKILSRITEPTAGDIKIYGRVSSLLEVGTGFHPELTGRENIYLNGSILGMRKAEIDQKFDEIVEFSEIEKFLDTPVKFYSSGMYVRLAFAVAANLDPEILLIDEVLAVGDAGFQKKCLNKMEDVGKSGRTILFVSHNMLAVKNLCKKGIVLDKGRCTYFNDINIAIEGYLSNLTDITGAVSWDSPNNAPGNHQLKLRAIKVVSEGKVTERPKVDKDIHIQIDYWNLEEHGKRVFSIQVIDGMNYLLFNSLNWQLLPEAGDPWSNREYPIGLFRTTCVIPKNFLKPGVYSIYLHIHGEYIGDIIIFEKDIISFQVEESDRIKNGYYGEHPGAVRPLLHWETTQLE